MSAPTLPTTRIRPYAVYELLGVSVTPRPARVAAVRVRVEGVGLESRFELLDSAECELPAELSDLLQASHQSSIKAAEFAFLRLGLSSSAASLVQTLLVEGDAELPLALGVMDPGWWQASIGEVHGYQSLCDAALLAEATGISVIDAFPARDIALGGAGGPLDSLPLWLLLHDARRSRLVVDVQSTTQLTYLPASCEASGASRVGTFDCGPGESLLEAIDRGWSTEKPSLSGHQPSGHTASNGAVTELSAWLNETWNADKRKWLPHSRTSGPWAEAFIALAKSRHASQETARNAAQLAMADFIVQCVADRVPRSPPLGQFVFAQQSPLSLTLRPYLMEKLSDVSQVDVAELEWESRWLPPACAAALAMLHVEQIPSGGTLLTGASAARVLGRLTPGTPPNWRRLLQRLAANQPTTMSLRSAI